MTEPLTCECGCGQAVPPKRRFIHGHNRPGRKKRGEDRSCEVCGQAFYVQPNQIDRGEGRFCSRQCKHEAQAGVERVVGTRYVRPDGYVAVKVGIRKYELEHRLVMEAAIGRKLTSDEHVHHLNEDRADNRLENLQLLTNAEHQRLHDHLSVRHPARLVDVTCQRCGATYQRKPSRAAISKYCSNPCRFAALHEGNRKT